MKITGVHEDITFRSPAILASFATAVLIFLLARRWFNRRVGLLAGCFWAIGIYMSRLLCQATPDMLLALWITLAIFCGDRLLFHPVSRARRGRWVVAFWAAMILAALSEGWGLVNFTVVGFMFVLAAVLRPGFGAVGRADTAGGRISIVLRLTWRRLARVVARVRLGWGVLACLAVLAPLLVGMIVQGGSEFANTLYFEIWRRITSAGPSPPTRNSVSSLLYLVYSPLPTSLFALVSLALVSPRRWFRSASPVSLPLCWIIAVVVPLSLVHGFRPDYLLLCYGALAIMGAWAVDFLHERRWAAGRGASLLRHACAAISIAVSLLLVVVPLIFLYRPDMPRSILKIFPMPAHVAAETWWTLSLLPSIGLAMLVFTVRSSLKWQLRRVAMAAIVGMLGVMFMYTHFLSQPARSGAGDRMRRFARDIRSTVDDDPFAVRSVGPLAVELYLGRFGWRTNSVEQLNQAACTWLITCDYGLHSLPARLLNGKADAGWKVGYRPGELGKVVRQSAPIKTYAKWGHLYLIRLRPVIKLVPVSATTFRPVIKLVPVSATTFRPVIKLVPVSATTFRPVLKLVPVSATTFRPATAAAAPGKIVSRPPSPVLPSTARGE